MEERESASAIDRRRSSLFPFDRHRLDRDWGDRLDARLCRLRVADLLDDVHAVDDLAKYRMLSCQPVGRRESNEELATVGVGTGVGHRENAGLIELAPRLEFVGELVAGTTGAVAEWIASLDHEVRDDAVEREPVVVRPLGFLARLRRSEERRVGKSVDLGGRRII